MSSSLCVLLIIKILTLKKACELQKGLSKIPYAQRLLPSGGKRRNAPAQQAQMFKSYNYILWFY